MTLKIIQMKKSLLIFFSSIQLLSGADEIVGLSLRSNSINIPVNPTAVAGAVLSLDANKRPVFSVVPATGVNTFLATPSSANLAAALTNETGTGALVFATTPTLVTPILGTPTSGTLTNCSGLPASGIASGYISDNRLYPLRPSSFAGTYDDDFTAASLDAKWTRQGLVSGDHTYQTGGGSWMTMDIPAGTTGSIARLIHQSWSSTTNATITCRIIHHQIGSAYPMFGPFFTDNSGNGIGVTLYNNTTGIIISTLSGWIYSSGALSVVYNIPNYNLLTPPTGLWMKLRKASTTYYACFSVDGIQWGPEVSVVNATAMTKVGLGLFLRAGGGSDYGAKMHFDFFKVE